MTQRKGNETQPKNKNNSSDAPLYFFDYTFAQRHPHILLGFTPLIDTFRNTSAVDISIDNDGHEMNAQFYLGPPMSGAPMHFHFAAANYLAFGRKLWALQSPATTMYGYQDAATFFASGQWKNSSLACVQNPDDILLVPTDWGHATLNLDVCLLPGT